MRMERLYIEGANGPAPYTGPMGIVWFTDGVSEAVDVDDRRVWRMVSWRDGGGNIVPEMRIMPREVVSDGVDDKRPDPPAQADCDSGADGREAVVAADGEQRESPRTRGKRRNKV